MYPSQPSHHQRQRPFYNRILDCVENIATEVTDFLEFVTEPVTNFLSLILQLAVRFLFAALPLLLIDRHIGIENWQLSTTGYIWAIAAYGLYLFGVGKFFRS